MSDRAVELVSEPTPSNSRGTDAPAETPFKELNYYEQRDRDRFAGREGDIQRLVARIETGRVVILYGRSGLGKTSLLLAGIFPQLEIDGFHPVYIRTLENPLCDVAEAIINDCDLPIDRHRDLKSLLAKAGVERPLVLVLDQFEEFFLRFTDRKRERAGFVREITRILTDPGNTTRLVFSLREDYLAALDEFQAKLPDIFTHSYRLAPLSAFGAREGHCAAVATRSCQL
jgi:hypothetical protein